MPIQSKAGGKTADKPAKPAAKPAAKAVTKTAAKPAVKPAAASKPKAAATAQPATSNGAVKKAPAAGRAKKTEGTVLPEQRRYYVEVAAYYIAERRGFNDGSEVEDWVQAEAEIDRLLREGVLNP